MNRNSPDVGPNPQLPTSPSRFVTQIRAGISRQFQTLHKRCQVFPRSNQRPFCQSVNQFTLTALTCRRCRTSNRQLSSLVGGKASPDWLQCRRLCPSQDGMTLRQESATAAAAADPIPAWPALIRQPPLRRRPLYIIDQLKDGIALPRSAWLSCRRPNHAPRMSRPASRNRVAQCPCRQPTIQLVCT